MAKIKDNSPFRRQLDNYYEGMVTKLNNLNEEAFKDQVHKSRTVLEKILSDFYESEASYPFIKIEQQVKATIKETLQQHILNILAYQILNWKQYNGYYVASKDDIAKADKSSNFDSNTENNIKRIYCYVNYLIEEKFIPQWLEDKIETINDDNQISHDQQYIEWAATHDSGDEKNGGTPPPSSPYLLEAESENAFSHDVFGYPDNLEYLVDFSRDRKEGIGWLIAEYTENVFDSDQDILDVIMQNSEDIDPVVAELILSSLYFYRDYDQEDLLSSFCNETEVGYGWLIRAYLNSLDDIQKNSFKQFIQKSIERLKNNYAIIVKSLEKHFKENIDAYDNACSQHDLPRAQKEWYIFSQKQRIFIKAYNKDYTSTNSIRRFETKADEALKKANKEFLSIFPAQLKTIYYSSMDSEKCPTLDVETEFSQLATLGKTIKGKMLENSDAFACTNVVVAELAFVVSFTDDPKNKTFIKVPITFHSNTKLLSKDISDSIVTNDDDYIKQIKDDHAAAQKIGLTVKAEEINGSTLERLFFHSERVLLAALRKKEIVLEIINKAQEKLTDRDTYEICGAVLVLYSTNSVCDNCAYSLIVNQNTNQQFDTIQSMFYKALTEQKITLLDDEFKLITLVRSDKHFSVQAKIFCGENKSFGNSKAKIYLDDDSIDLRKIFELPNWQQILIESVGNDIKEAELSEKKSLAFMSGSKKSKLSNSKNKIKQLENSISDLYNAHNETEQILLSGDQDNENEFDME